jgi:hypothetical protein
VITYTLAAIGAGIILVLGIPFVERLLKRVWPSTPKEDEAREYVERARRSIDHIPR